MDLSVIRVLDCCLVPKPQSAISTLLLALTILQDMEVERWQKKQQKKKQGGLVFIHYMSGFMASIRKEGVILKTCMH